MAAIDAAPTPTTLLLLPALLGLACAAQAATTLSCPGSGSVSQSQTSNSQEYSYKTHSFDKSTSSATTVRRPFSGTVNVEMGEGFVRLKFPADVVPPLSDGRDSWYSLNDAAVGERDIKGHVKFNFANKPDVHIDRVSGQIAIRSGFADFTGNCAVVDPKAAPKF